VLRNLLANADRFTPANGHIDVLLEDDGKGGWRLQVIDDGPGLVEAERERIFERFVQSDSPRQAKGGTGLGLSIARGIAELHGGTLMASNAPGRGACFTLTLPADSAAATTEGPRG
jgi:two-component system OmpR family sensor kinase